jgi:hypothetical protein
MPHMLADAFDFEVMHSLRRLILKVCSPLHLCLSPCISYTGIPISEVVKVNSNELCNT